MGSKRPGRVGRPRTDPNDPQLAVNPQRVRVALMFSGLSHRDVQDEARRRKLPPLTLKAIHGLGTGQQRTSRRSRLEALATILGVTVKYLTDQADKEDRLDTLAHAFADRYWDVYSPTYPDVGSRAWLTRVFDNLKAVPTDARVVLDVEAWRRRCTHDPKPLSRAEREEAEAALLNWLRIAFGPPRRYAALRDLRAWLEASPE